MDLLEQPELDNHLKKLDIQLIQMIWQNIQKFLGYAI
jgi:hypothetical protein